jgi:hypothetical protein
MSSRRICFEELKSTILGVICILYEEESSLEGETHTTKVVEGEFCENGAQVVVCENSNERYR